MIRYLRRAARSIVARGPSLVVAGDEALIHVNSGEAIRGAGPAGPGGEAGGGWFKLDAPPDRRRASACRQNREMGSADAFLPAGSHPEASVPRPVIIVRTS
ncbi:MAG: hypothetical protein JSS16_12900 [Proteobacteria bacterium]|uniref:hypothetical protein n=1 Tax=Rudaea sp. TaxID=2136325 RepID=UPI001DF6F763|nr:hypothetical protein [Pseudomonadota bacterium]MBS0566855.1 hypothetical protein [Pseudomonadota bacterium]